MSGSTPLLLCTDLDRTLLPNGAQPESAGARARFDALVAHPDVMLAYVTGRSRALAEAAMFSYALPTPGFVIGDVGTSVYDLRGGAWTQHAGWQSDIAPDWNGLDREQLSRLLTGVPSLRLQERAKQNTFKLSYYVPLHADRSRLDEQIGDRLRAHGVCASLVWSVDEPAGVGLLDVLPRRATKLHAVHFLCELLEVPLERTLFAGDSGNDLALMESDVPSVLVANASPQVAQEALAAARRAGNESRLHLARGGLAGMNGNYAAGILEGVAHFHPALVERFLPEGVAT